MTAPAPVRVLSHADLAKRGRAVGLVGAITLGGMAFATVGARQPGLVAIALAGAALLWFLLPRLALATAVLAGSFFYDDYFTERFGFWNPGKFLGVIALASLCLVLIRERRPLVWSPQVAIMATLVGSMAISYTLARSPAQAAQVGVRYAMFFALFFLVLQAIRSRRDVDDIIDVMIVAGTLAALIGLSNFLFHGYTRVSGPLNDPGDFGFQLASTVPLILYRIASTSGARRVCFAIACAVVLGAILGSFSRASLAGLAVGGAWAMATGRVRVRWGVAVLVTMALIGLVAYRLEPDAIESSFSQKQYVAQRNIDSRFGLWEVAIMEWQSAPLFGVGPGNYEVRFPEFRSPLRQRIETTHSAYLNVLAELGILGLALFVAFLGESWRQLRRRPAAGERDVLRTALAAAFVVALVGAFFMTQQYYPPLWFLAAIGTAMNKRDDRDDPRLEAAG